MKISITFYKKCLLKFKMLEHILKENLKKNSGNFVLPGTIIHVAYGSIPTGYLDCDGSTYLRTAYPELFKVIGTIYGSTDSTNFKVPDFRGRFLRGFGANSSSIGVPQGDGAPNITCSFGNIPQSIVYIDINGGKSPNIIGKDVFLFHRVPGKGILPSGYQQPANTVSNVCQRDGQYCAAKIMQDGWKITYPY